MTERLCRTVALISLLTLVSGIAVAETMYIIDELRVGIRSEAKTTGRAIQLIATGIPFEVVERDGSFMRIRTKNDVEGWIPSRYATAQRPAKQRLDELGKRYQSLQKEHKELLEGDNGGGEGVVQLTAQLEQNRVDLANLKAENSMLSVQLLASEEERATLVKRSQQPSVSESPPTPKSTGGQPGFKFIVIMILAVVLAMLIGFAIGAIWYSRRASSRFGGLRPW